MGPGKALSETRDTTERVFPAIISAISDASQDVRYWGRKMISLLSQHSDFNRLAERHLSANDARQVIDETAKVEMNKFAFSKFHFCVKIFFLAP